MLTTISFGILGISGANRHGEKDYEDKIEDHS
jgi:hypothetical protein